MKTYAEKVIGGDEKSRDDLTIFYKIRRMVRDFPEPSLGVDESGGEIILSCHMLAEALSRIFNIEVRHGRYASYHEHSWLVIESGNIIDVYPVGVVGGPILIAKAVASRLYVTRKDVERHFIVPSYKKSVDAVENALRVTISKYLW